MLFMIHCTDKPGHAEVRKANRAAHLEYARRFQDRMMVGGPTLGPDGESMTGSVIIMEFPDIEAAHTFTRDDPYNQAGLFESVVVRPMKKVLPEAPE